MRFGIPRYRLPRDVLDAEIERILDLGVELELDRKVDDLLATMRDGGFDAAFLAVGAHLGKRAYIPAGVGRAGCSTPSRCCAAWRARSRRCSAGASSSTAAATRPSTPRARRSAWAPRRRSSSTGAPATGCRRTTSRSRRRSRRASLVKWLSTIKHADGGRLVLERMELDDDRLPAADRRARGARGRLARARARPGERPLAARRRRRHRDRRRRRAGRRAT